MEGSLEQMKLDLTGVLSGIEGWLDLETAWTLHELARCFPASRSDITVIEIGCWKGRTTAALALGLKARGGGKVYAVDPHTGSEQTIWECGPMDTYDAFVGNITKAELTDFVEPIRATSHQARGRFPNSSAHVLIVDASREEGALLEYIDDWSTALAEGAVAGFRDPFDIYHILRQRILRSRSPFRTPIIIDDSNGPILLLEFHKQRPWKVRDNFALLFLAAQCWVHSLRGNEELGERMPQWVSPILEATEGALEKACLLLWLHRQTSRPGTDG